MIRALYRTQAGSINTDLAVADFADALQDSEGLLWVDLGAEASAACRPILEDIFGFHPLAVDDALEETHVPRVDDWGSYLYLSVRAIDPRQDPGHLLQTIELDMFLGRNYVVTHHSQPVAALECAWTLAQRGEHPLSRDTSYLLYRLVDEIASDYILAAENIDDGINEIEDRLFERAEPALLERVFAVKRDLLHLRRIIAPQREMVNKLARGDFAVIEPAARIYFRDVYDHFVRLYDIVENLRDLTGSALEIYLSVVNNRMNDTMKTLTIITTLFMPISFLTGFFGMNFFQPAADMPRWTGWPVFLLLMAVMVLLPTSMYVWIRRRMWT